MGFSFDWLNYGIFGFLLILLKYFDKIKSILRSIMNRFIKPKIVANSDIHSFKWHKSTKQKPRHVKVLRFEVKNDGWGEAKNCQAHAKIKYDERMPKPEIVSWETEMPPIEVEKVTYFKGDTDRFVKAVRGQWLKWEKHITIPAKTDPETYINLMIFVEGEDNGYLITRKKEYEIKFRTEPYTLILRFNTDRIEREYELNLTSYDNIDRAHKSKKFDKIIKLIDP